MPIFILFLARSAYATISPIVTAKCFDVNGNNVTYLTNPTIGWGAGDCGHQNPPATKSQSFTIQSSVGSYRKNIRSNTPDAYILLQAVSTNNANPGVGLPVLTASVSSVPYTK